MASLSRAVSFLFPAALLLSGGCLGQAQCLENHYVNEGTDSSQVDCQPFASLKDVPAEQMTADAQSLLISRHVDLVRAAGFRGFNLDAPGWVYHQSISPLVQNHLILVFDHPGPTRDRARFVAVLPLQSEELVQVVPAYSRGLHPFHADWQDKGTYAVFNRLLGSERGHGPLTSNSEWVNFASLYLALAGGMSAIPIETDSVIATWNLGIKRATTPVIITSKDGSAVIAFSDLSEPGRTVSWNLEFDKRGLVKKASRHELRPQTVKIMLTAKDHAAEAMPAPSSLNR